MNGVFGDAELLGNRAVRKPVQLAKRKHLPAARGKRRNGLTKYLDFLGTIKGLTGGGPILYHGQTLDIGYGGD
jgi:hypothetical protein